MVNRRHVLEFALGLYRARTGAVKTGRSKLPEIVMLFLRRMSERYPVEVDQLGLQSWLAQEGAFT